MDTTEKVHKELKKHLQKEAKVVVACSGGKDSLTALALAMSSPLNLDILVCHVDHSMRKESKQQATKVVEFCNSLGLRCYVGTLPPKDYSEAEASLERRKILLAISCGYGAVHIITGHTASDQLETILMRICRGTGTRGVAGLSHCDNIWLRPLLTVTTKETDEYIQKLGWPVQEDSSNYTDKYTRNRFRHHITPFFLKENSKAEEAAVKLANAIREDDQALDYYVEREWHQHFSASGCDNISNLLKLPRGIVKRLIHKLWKWHCKDGLKQLTSHHLNNTVRILEAPPGNKLIQLPGNVTLYKIYNTLCVQ